LSYAPVKRTNRQTDGLEHSTHADRQSGQQTGTAERKRIICIYTAVSMVNTCVYVHAISAISIGGFREFGEIR